MLLRHKYLLLLRRPKSDDFSVIEENLYLGNRDFASNYQTLKSIGISLVIAVYPKHIKFSYLRPPNCRFHHIEANDAIHEDLISHFDHCFDLISQELDLNRGKVLVFCGAGLSRSVTIVAAFLMKKYRISAEEAVERVRQKRDHINPNIGFLGQLNLYEDMDYTLDRFHAEYRLFVLINLKKKMWSDSYWKDTKVGELKRTFCEPMQSYLDKLKPSGSHSERSQIFYKCINCDQILFEGINVLININRDRRDAKNDCPKIFIEPMRWMMPLICRNKSSKLNCPNCSVNLGSYKWKSYVCDCSFHNELQDSRIFKINKSNVVKDLE